MPRDYSIQFLNRLTDSPFLNAVTVRAPHGIDLRAGYKPWPGGPRGVLSGPPGVRDVYFLPIRPNRRTSLLRLGSELSAVAGQRCVLA